MMWITCCEFVANNAGEWFFLLVFEMKGHDPIRVVFAA